MHTWIENKNFKPGEKSEENGEINREDIDRALYLIVDSNMIGCGLRYCYCCIKVVTGFGEVTPLK